MPEIKDITPVLKNTAAMGGGFVAGNVLKELLMGTSLLNRTEPLIPDNIATNAGGVAVSLIGAVAAKTYLKGETSDLLAVTATGMGTYFLIRLLNKATDSLSGLGNEEEAPVANGIKDWLNKLVPRLSGTEEMPVASPAQVEEFRRMIESYNPGARVIPVEKQLLYGTEEEVANRVMAAA
ncbi:MAG: hypothetical protein EP332_06390 [Bacteroidetes bacterium]|nr:MAG: hypothetical protein EP332_06390 [Bacteroidota bacterium]